MKLAELEQYFARVATSTSGPPDDVEAMFKPTPRLSASAALGIYNRGYHYRLLGALASVFERTKRALGAAEFERLGLRYLARYPSEHPAIERVGRAFSEYLRTLSDVGAAIADLAALEWARLCALVAPNPDAIATTQSVELTTFPESRLCFVPSLSLLSIRSDALTWFAQQTPLATHGEQCGVAVWRKRNLVRHEALEALEQGALELALTGASVSRICASFDSGAETEDVARAFRIVSAWFEREWIERSVLAAP